MEDREREIEGTVGGFKRDRQVTALTSSVEEKNLMVDKIKLER